jgi:hypothetical protein
MKMEWVSQGVQRMARIGTCISRTGFHSLHFKLPFIWAHSDYSYRFVDRDMMMCYYWGLGIGHLYADSTAQPPTLDKTDPLPEVLPSSGLDGWPSMPEDAEVVEQGGLQMDVEVGFEGDNVGDGDNDLHLPKLGLEDHEGDVLDSDSEDGSVVSNDVAEQFSDDETFLSHFSG